MEKVRGAEAPIIDMDAPMGSAPTDFTGLEMHPQVESVELDTRASLESAPLVDEVPSKRKMPKPPEEEPLTFGGLTLGEIAVHVMLLDGLGTVNWRLKALCQFVDDIEIFYPEKSNTVTQREPARICLECPVRRECLEAALDEETRAIAVFGYRGGMGERGRRKIWKKRRAGK